MATIHEYRAVTPTIARVTASFDVANVDAEMLAISAALNNSAAPVAGSFRRLDGETFVGYVSATRAVIPLDGATPGKGFRVMAANIYMDEGDKSLWEVKNGAGGSYMARQGQEDLSALLETARVSPRGSIPRLSRVLSASVATHDFVAFVRAGRNTAEMDYGFCVERTEDAYIVMSTFDKQAVSVPSDLIVSAMSLPRDEMPRIPKAAVQSAMKTRGAETAASRTDPVLSPQDYYRLAYSYAPGYVEKIIKQISEMGY